MNQQPISLAHDPDPSLPEDAMRRVAKLARAEAEALKAQARADIEAKLLANQV